MRFLYNKFCLIAQVRVSRNTKRHPDNNKNKPKQPKADMAPVFSN